MTTLASGDSLNQLAIDGANAYWTTSPNDPAQGTVMRVPLAGGVPTTLASAQYFPQGIALAAGNVYWASRNNKSSWGFAGQVFSEPSGGGTPKVIGGYAGDPYEVATNSTNVFWSAWNDDWTGSDYLHISAVLTAPLGGGTATTVAAMPDDSSRAVGAIAADDASLYYVAGGQTPPYGIVKVPLNGAQPVTMASVAPTAMVIDATSLYWADSAGSPASGRVMMLSPK